MGKTRRFLSKIIKPAKLPIFNHKSRTHSFRNTEKEEQQEELREISTSKSKEACFVADTIQEEEEEEEVMSDGKKSTSSSVSEYLSCTSSSCSLSSVSDYFSCSSLHELLNENEEYLQEARDHHDHTDQYHSTSLSSVSDYFSCSSFDELLPSKQLVLDCEKPEMLPELSRRFFFFPSTTKSIMEESREHDDPSGFLSTKSVTIALASDDPYCDFRTSMEEIVEVHRLTNHWPQLLELLSCYLRLNEKRNHKIILLAFMDLILQLTAQQDS